MSILLDALKKSEQERQLGQAPTLRSGSDEQSAEGSATRSWVPVSMVFLSAAAIGWFGWQQFQAPEAGVISVPSSDTQVEAVSPEGRAKSGADSEAVPDAKVKQGRTLTELYGLKRKKSAASDEKPVNGEGAERGRLSRSVKGFTAKNKGSKAAAKAASTPANASGQFAQRSKARSPDPRPTPAASRQEKRQALEPHVPEPISYWELPQAVRDNLPEIKITVLVFAEKSDDRFLLTNGQRMVEKEEIGGGLVLDEIRKDGAVFLYRNYRFLVKG